MAEAARALFVRMRRGAWPGGAGPRRRRRRSRLPCARTSASCLWKGCRGCTGRLNTTPRAFASAGRGAAGRVLPTRPRARTTALQRPPARARAATRRRTPRGALEGIGARLRRAWQRSNIREVTACGPRRTPPPPPPAGPFETGCTFDPLCSALLRCLFVQRTSRPQGGLVAGGVLPSAVHPSARSPCAPCSPRRGRARARSSFQSHVPCARARRRRAREAERWRVLRG